MFRLKINKTVNNNYNYMSTHLRFKIKKRRREKFRWIYNEKKLNNNIARAKSSIFNIVNYNKFEFFFTQTISSTFARSDLNNLISNFRLANKRLKNIYNGDFYYVIIPEYHLDKRNWHLHGFLSSAYGLDSYINKNGFLSVHELDKIGWNSISKIKNYTACCKYITKYITKAVASDIKKGERFYYCSKGLKRENLVNDFIFTGIPPLHFDFKTDYVFKAQTDKNKYYKFITDIDKLNLIHYYDDM